VCVKVLENMPNDLSAGRLRYRELINALINGLSIKKDGNKKGERAGSPSNTKWMACRASDQNLDWRSFENCMAWEFWIARDQRLQKCQKDGRLYILS